MERDGKLLFSEFKGRNHKAKHHQLASLPPLRTSIDYAAGNPRHLVYPATTVGTQRNVKGLGNWFARQFRGRHHLAVPYRGQGVAPTPRTWPLLLRG